MARRPWAPALACVLCAAAAAAESTLPVRLVLPRGRIAPDTFVVTKVVRTADLAITFAARSGYTDRPAVPLGPGRSLVGVTVGSLSKGSVFGGVTALSPTATRVRAVKLKRKRPRKPRRRAAGTVERRARLDASIARVAVDDGSFSVEGPRAEPWMALAGRDVVATAAVLAGRSCYNQPDGFTILETSREFAAARDRELALCRSGRVDPASCSDPSGYQPPNAAIGGRFVSDGSTWTIALGFTDEGGRTDVTASATGDFGEFPALLEEAGALLGQRICEARTLGVTLGSDIPERKHCGTTGLGSCDCCPDGDCPKGSYWEGLGFAGEMRGGVGTRFELSGDMDYAVIRCGAWSSVGCGNGLCCARDSGQQPAGTRFEASFLFPRETTRVACFCDAGAYTTTLTARVTIGTRTKEATLDVECVD